MSNSRISRLGWVALGLAVLAALVGTVNEIADFRRTGAVDWGHVAIIVGMPAFMYAIVSRGKA